MCGRFALSAMLTDIAEEFSTLGDSDSPRNLPVDWNIKPTQDIYIIKAGDIKTSESIKRRIDVVSWGLIAPWSKN